MTTDYTSYSLLYRVRKAARYGRLYGVPRTIEKIRGQYHMREPESLLSSSWQNPDAGKRTGRDIGILGCGNFAFSNIAFYCQKIRPNSVRAVYDPQGQRAISLVKRYKAAYAASSARQIIEDPAIQTIFIASNHASHAEYAIDAIKLGKTVHIEKPHVVSRDQLNRLYRACIGNPSAKVFLGFNRPRSRHFKHLMRFYHQESGPAMINWFIAGHALEPGHWYFSKEEGGRVLGNLCHWTDLTLRMIGLENAFPMQISAQKAVGSESDFVVNIAFADNSIAAITFSAKGHTFEGVREYLNVHRGNALMSLRDFHHATVDVGYARYRLNTLFRDHGHKAAIQATLDANEPEPLEMIAESANLFLAVREAIDSGKQIMLQRYQPE